MPFHDVEQILQSLVNDTADVQLAMVVTKDGLPLSYQGSSDDFDLTAAIYIELEIICNKLLSELGLGMAEQFFFRAKHGCVVIWPIDGVGLLACMAKNSVDANLMQMKAWRAVSSLRKLQQFAG